MNWIAFFLLLPVFFFLLRKAAPLGGEGIQYRWLVCVFCLRVFCGLAYGYLDLHSHHPGDSLNYFNDGCWIHNAAREHPEDYVRMVTGIADTSQFIRERYVYYLQTWKANDYDYFFNDSRTIVRVHAFLCLFSFGNYGVHVLVFALLGLIGQLLLFRIARDYCRLPAGLLFAIFFFLPTAMVWFASLLKEPLVILGMGLAAAGIVPSVKNKSLWKRVLLAACGIIILLLLRFYVLLCAAPAIALGAWLWYRPGKVLLKTSVVIAAVVIIAASFDYFATDYKFSRILYDQLMNTVKTATYFDPGTAVSYHAFEPRLSDIILNAPAAALRAAAAPIHRIFSNPYRFLFFVENILLLLLAGSILRHPERPGREAMPLLAASILFVLLLYTLAGLTTPFEGTLVRIRSVAQPFLLFSLLCFAGRSFAERLPLPRFLR